MGPGGAQLLATAPISARPAAMARARIDDGPPGRIGNLLMIWRYASRYPATIVCAALALLLAAGATLAIPDGFRRVIDKGFVAGGGNISVQFNYLFLMVIVLALATACRFYFVSMLGEKVIADVRTAVHDNLLRLEPRFFEENGPSEIASRVTSYTAVIEIFVGSTVSVALRNIVLGIGGVIYLFTLAPTLTAWLLVGMPPIVLPIVLLGRRVRNISRSSQDRIADLGSIVAETLGAMKIVQGFGQEARESGRFRAAVLRAFNPARRRALLRAIMTAIVITLLSGSITMLVRQAAIDVSHGAVSGGTVVAFVITGAIVAGAFGALTEVYGELLRGAGVTGRIAELMAQVPQIRAPAHPAALPEPARGLLEFDRVPFRYPTRPDVSALHEFSLTVAPGETLAVVGPSGAGKTTIFQLAQRFYD